MTSRLCRPCEREAHPQRNWLVWFDQKWKKHSPLTRAFVARYFRPNRIERYRSGLVYRVLGVKFVALVIPTGGLIWRRLFHWDGWSFGLGTYSVRKAREYRYNTCVFEVLHASAVLLMLPDGVRAVLNGYVDGIVHFLVAGVIVNGYPWMLQRYNRVRIAALLEKRRNRESL